MNASSSILTLVLTLGVVTLTGCRPSSPPAATSDAPPVRLGVEVLLAKRLDLVRGMRVGLITNPTGCTSDLQGVVDLRNTTSIESPFHIWVHPGPFFLWSPAVIVGGLSVAFSWLLSRARGRATQ